LSGTTRAKVYASQAEMCFEQERIEKFSTAMYACSVVFCVPCMHPLVMACRYRAPEMCDLYARLPAVINSQERNIPAQNFLCFSDSYLRQVVNEKVDIWALGSVNPTQLACLAEQSAHALRRMCLANIRTLCRYCSRLRFSFTRFRTEDLYKSCQVEPMWHQTQTVQLVLLCVRQI
jgi:hypothetical protein